MAWLVSLLASSFRRVWRLSFFNYLLSFLRIWCSSKSLWLAVGLQQRCFEVLDFFPRGFLTSLCRLFGGCERLRRGSSSSSSSGSLTMRLCPQPALLTAPGHPDADPCFDFEVEPGRLEDLNGLGRSHRVFLFQLPHVTPLGVQGAQVAFVLFLSVFNALDFGLQALLNSLLGRFSLRCEPWQVVYQLFDWPIFFSFGIRASWTFFQLASSALATSCNSLSFPDPSFTPLLAGMSPAREGPAVSPPLASSSHRSVFNSGLLGWTGVPDTIRVSGSRFLAGERVSLAWEGPAASPPSTSSLQLSVFNSGLLGLMGALGTAGVSGPPWPSGNLAWVLSPSSTPLRQA